MAKTKRKAKGLKGSKPRSKSSAASSPPPKEITSTSKKSSGRLKKPKKPKLEDLAKIPEPLKSAGPGRPLCERCGLCSKSGLDPVTPWIPDGWTGKLLLVGPPPEDDGEYVRPLKAKIGKFIRRLAADLGYSDVDVGFVSAIRSPVDSPTMDQLRCCRPFLLYAINKLKPKGILGLGKLALKALTNSNNQNITKARGKNLEVPGLCSTTKPTSAT